MSNNSSDNENINRSNRDTNEGSNTDDNINNIGSNNDTNNDNNNDNNSGPNTNFYYSNTNTSNNDANYQFNTNPAISLSLPFGININGSASVNNDSNINASANLSINNPYMPPMRFVFSFGPSTNIGENSNLPNNIFNFINNFNNDFNDEPINEPINESIIYPINHPINHPINEPDNELINEPDNEDNDPDNENNEPDNEDNYDDLPDLINYEQANAEVEQELTASMAGLNTSLVDLNTELDNIINDTMLNMFEYNNNTITNIITILDMQLRGHPLYTGTACEDYNNNLIQQSIDRLYNYYELKYILANICLYYLHYLDYEDLTEISAIFKRCVIARHRRRSVRNLLFEMLMSSFQNIIEQPNGPIANVNDKLTDEEFNKLKKISLDELKIKNEFTEHKCCICRECYETSDEIIELPCSAHNFHKDCIYEWTTEHHCTCPMCRTNCRI